MSATDGPILFAYCLDILLYGILTVQTYIYYLSFPGDRRLTKATVAFIYVVGTLQTAFALHDFYSISCLPRNQAASDVSFGTENQLHSFGFMWITIPLSGASVATVCQLFYAQRIHMLSGKKLISGVVIVLAFVQFAFGIYTTFASYGSWTTRSELFPILIFGRGIDAMGWETSGAICDFVITIYMFRFLSSRIQQSQVYKPMRVSLLRIKRLTLETGLTTTGVAMSYVVLSMLGGPGFVIPGLALSKVYGNSILALLNSRLRIPGGREEIDSVNLVNHLALEHPQTEFQRNVPACP